MVNQAEAVEAESDPALDVKQDWQTRIHRISSFFRVRVANSTTVSLLQSIGRNCRNLFFTMCGNLDPPSLAGILKKDLPTLAPSLGVSIIFA